MHHGTALVALGLTSTRGADYSRLGCSPPPPQDSAVPPLGHPLHASGRHPPKRTALHAPGKGRPPRPARQPETAAQAEAALPIRPKNRPAASHWRKSATQNDSVAPS
eukprot:CAMPEP_0204527088 /NCGR_PEP_ID=MMETSP0661-20131031/8785_1 /ASSEMBLY_ACC=CAM_ASM_000606 /TAXON_ID=109239 /ORGANISM="Alexandrium margalefi, Strain AMGDE01CS-322" /LENGTH=106 /DNA_ID=CAMNT_0051532963 /DNA_START=145 /DNA_END=465 /DNA_ORIENTATION=-